MVADPQRCTTKVRQAAQMAAQAAAAGRGATAVQIVDKGWLLASFSAWERAPEAPYRIVVDGEPLGASIGDVGDGDKDAVGTPDRKAGRPADLVINVDGTDDDMLEDEEMLDELASPIEDIMANISGNQWDKWDDELRQFLDEDDSDTGSERAAAVPTPPDVIVTEHEDDEDGSAGRNKRKREPADIDGGSPRDIAAVPDPPVAAPVVVEPESELQRRKKRAFERTSSLTQVANADAPVDVDMGGGGQEADVVGGKKAAAEEKAPNGKGVHDGEDDEDYDAAAMEAEMLAAFEMEGEDDVKGDG